MATTATLAAQVEGLYGSAAGGQNLRGNDLSNRIETSAGNDSIDGGLGADTMLGAAGDDMYFVDNAGDRVVEAAGAGKDWVRTNLTEYALTAEVENLNSALGTGATLIGNLLANAIAGNAGVDVLDGREGKDTLTGSAGDDTFIFKSALGTTNIDQITDFNAAADSIKLENTGLGLFNALTGGALPASAFKIIGPTGTAVDADDRILYNQSTGALFYDADGSGGGAKVQFATLTNGAVLSAADFIVF